MKKKVYPLLFSILLWNIVVNSLFVLQAEAFDPESNIVLNNLEFHAVPVNATKGEALSGDWEVTPADLFAFTFIVFIINSTGYEEWISNDNLTQALDRIPSNEMIYHYDPIFRLDDIIGDNRRSDSINVKVPYEDTWYFVMFAGATLVPLTFSWHIDVVYALLLDIVLYGLIGVFGIVIIVIFTIVTIKRKKLSPEEEFHKIVDEEREKQSPSSTSLEEENE
ncbi:MAG: hypothetical protein ACFFDW_10550 [Candidatus Thorarchaeota archaeon]